MDEYIYGGGNGLSFENSIIITNATNSSEGVSGEYDYIENNYEMIKIMQQQLVSRNKRYFDILKFRIKGGKIITLYFDITNFFKHN